MQKQKQAFLTAVLVAVLTVHCWAAPQTAATSSRTERDAGENGLMVGVAWYPEHWDESRWQQDLTLMKQADIKMVRIAEFAWSRMEPEEGRYDLDWLERAVNLAGKNGIKVVLGTPSAAPPAWLTQKYPETLAIWENGRQATHGNRVHYRFTSERYLDFCRKIATEMAKRFGQNPYVIGWQIDNEYGPVSYDEETRKVFQEFLHEKYKTLDALNQHWSTNYWSQTYSDWSQIPIPVGYHNPSLMLEWKHFIGETFRKYQRVQLEAIRAYAASQQFITHNFMGFNGNFDHYVLSADLDFASWDHYVGSGHLDYLWSGGVHDLTRGFKRKNFWVMETQPGSVNWAGVNNMLNRGEMRRMAWQGIGHGADVVAYWQWRSALGGQEQYHGSLVGADGKPRLDYLEAAQIAKEFSKAREALSGTAPKPQTALLFDYDSRWATEFQRHHKDFDAVGLLHSYYRPLRELTQDIDIVHPSAPLSSYKLVVAPALNVMSEATARHLIEYVRSGGHLVLGPRSAMKDEYNALLPSRQPGTILSELLGGDVVEFFALEKNVPVSGAIANGDAKIWADMMESTDPSAEVLLRYGKSNGWLDNQPAVITRRIGAGRITYVGPQLDEKAMQGLTQWMVKTSGVQPLLPGVPPGVEITRRIGNGREVFVVINHSNESQAVPLPNAMRNVLSGAVVEKQLTISANDVAVLTKAVK